jgi:hypothetical protein
MKGGVRSYVKRWFHTIKDRLRMFSWAFPRSSRGLENAHVFLRFLRLLLQPRPTTPIPEPKHTILSGKGTRIQRLQKALEVKKALS